MAHVKCYLSRFHIFRVYNEKILVIRAESLEGGGQIIPFVRGGTMIFPITKITKIRLYITHIGVIKIIYVGGTQILPILEGGGVPRFC